MDWNGVQTVHVRGPSTAGGVCPILLYIDLFLRKKYHRKTSQTKDHALIFGTKNQRMIILNGHNPNRVADVETPTCMCSGWKYIDAAENEESLEPEDRRQRPRVGSVELSPTGTE